MREAFRKNMKNLADGHRAGGPVTILFMYMGAGKPNYKHVKYVEIEKSIVQLLQSLRESL